MAPRMLPRLAPLAPLAPLALILLILSTLGAALPKGTLQRVPPGVSPGGTSFRPSISANGRWLAFSSRANNLVPDDVPSDASEEIYLFDTRKQD